MVISVLVPVLFSAVNADSTFSRIYSGVSGVSACGIQVAVAEEIRKLYTDVYLIYAGSELERNTLPLP